MLLSQRLLTRARITAVAVVAAVLGVLAPGVAHAAAAPSNDDFDHPAPIAALPFSTQEDTGGATKATDDPFGCQGYDQGGSVWFQYTATEDGLLRATAAGSDHSTILSAYTGPRVELRSVANACGIGKDATMTFRVTAGTTYSFMVAGYDVPGGALSFAVDRIAPAANDNFANAEPFSALPLTRRPDLSIASIEADEPQSSCDGDARTAPSVWYAYTTPGPATSVTAKIDGYGSTVTVYAGNSLPELKQVACTSNYREATAFRANPGATYYVRVTGPYMSTQPITLSLAEAPPLDPQFSVSPSSPSVYDTVSFAASSWNSIDQPMTVAWDFGDGTSAPATTDSVHHNYTVDGDYPVTMHATSPDGRTVTKTTTLTVNTHDVGITKFDVPTTAREGQQKSITVHVANTRYAEKPTVVLYRSDGSSWTQVGTLTLDVPARAKGTVQFPFAYTFTAQDALVGKVTFRAEVQLPYPVQDARRADNEVIAIATTVKPRATTRFAS
ncbi:PKD domain-containing protein [Kutzneria sp. CA-103260]|uniref:PKD domain-containing protein n=1 Tax=Kutzneria sp. CA-103260 TaxID=2802641 RepID=UPI001BADA8A5|nr:PKD domain-containing protein [Kutzneria sp. CA-103260]QUQ68696.1 PKD domain protein [Kutzneria sp. CA-103260]